MTAALQLPVMPEVAAEAEAMVALRRRLHTMPELGFQEVQTSALVAERLAAWGYEVHTGIAGTGVVGTLRCGSGERRLGLRADMDALPIAETTGLPWASQVPGRMHACGHDGHTATLLAAARVLGLTRGFDGTLQLIFQPAEEGLGGAGRMVEDGLFERFPCDVLYAFHNLPGYPAGKLGLREGVIYNASDTVIVTVRGRGGHGAMPHRAVDTVLAASHIVVVLQTLVAREVDPNEFAVVSVGAFHAGEAPNVIPDHAELRLTVRARSAAVRAFLRERITELVQAQAAVHGARAEVDYRWRYPPVINDARATAFAREVALDWAGPAALIEDLPPQHASDDFALLLEQVPGCYLVLGNGADSCIAHDPGYDFNDAILPGMASYWVELARRYLVS
ncbi:MAG: M20 aminoacylase family protein [Rubrivivax sp.]